MHDSARMPAAFAAAVTLHTLVLAMIASRGPVRLSLVPSPLVVDIVAASRTTAGPGAFSEQLHVASAPAAAVQPARSEAAAMPAQKPAESKKTQPSPKSVVAAPRTVAPKKPAQAEVAAGALRDSGGSDAPPAAEVASIGTGSGSSSTAPAWAQSARVQYESVLYGWINRHKLYPMLAQRRGLEGSAAVRVRIDRDGRVIDRSLDRSTGQPLLDEAALDIVRRASPFPKVPPEYSGSTFEFVAPIEYRLHEVPR
jgi:protein TonB